MQILFVPCLVTFSTRIYRSFVALHWISTDCQGHTNHEVLSAQNEQITVFSNWYYAAAENQHNFFPLFTQIFWLERLRTARTEKFRNFLIINKNLSTRQLNDRHTPNSIFVNVRISFRALHTLQPCHRSIFSIAYTAKVWTLLMLTYTLIMDAVTNIEPLPPSLHIF